MALAVQQRQLGGGAGPSAQALGIGKDAMRDALLGPGMEGLGLGGQVGAGLGQIVEGRAAQLGSVVGVLLPRRGGLHGLFHQFVHCGPQKASSSCVMDCAQGRHV
jgi:hypothetical protein